MAKNYEPDIIFDPQEINQQGMTSSVIPVTGQVAGGFNDPRDGGTRQHKGGDILASPGSPVVAPADMEYIAGGIGGSNLRDNDAWAHFKDVNTGREYRFAHISAPPDVKPGQVVPRGAVWGSVGNVIDNPHLHMSVVDSEKGHVDWMKEAGLNRGDKIGGQEQPQEPTNYKALAELWKGKTAELQEMADAVADHYQVPRDIMRALAGHESSWNPTAKNPKSSATGLGQFIDSTAQSYFDEPISKGGSDPNDPRYHPGKSLDAMARLLKDNYDKKGNWAEAIKSYGEGTDEYLQRVARQWKKDQAQPVGVAGSIAAGLQEGLAKTAGIIASIPARGTEYLMSKAGDWGFPPNSPEELQKARDLAQSTQGQVERTINPNPYGPSQGFTSQLVRGLASGVPELAGIALAGLAVPHVGLPNAIAQLSPLIARLAPAMAHSAGTFGLWDLLKGEGPEQAAIGAGMGAALPIVGPTFGRLARGGYGAGVGGAATLAQTLSSEGRMPTPEELGLGMATMGIYHGIGSKQRPVDPNAGWSLDLSQFAEPPKTPPGQLGLPGREPQLALPWPQGFGPGEQRGLPPGPTVSGTGFSMGEPRPDVVRRPYDYTQDPRVNAVTAPANYPPVLETIPGISPNKALGLRPQDVMDRLVTSAAGLPDTAGLRSGPTLGMQLPPRYAEMPRGIPERLPVAPPETLGESISQAQNIQPTAPGAVLEGSREIKPLGLVGARAKSEVEARKMADESNGYAFRWAGRGYYVSPQEPPKMAGVEVIQKPEVKIAPITNKEKVIAAEKIKTAPMQSSLDKPELNKSLAQGKMTLEDYNQKYAPQYGEWGSQKWAENFPDFATMGIKIKDASGQVVEVKPPQGGKQYTKGGGEIEEKPPAPTIPPEGKSGAGGEGGKRRFEMVYRGEGGTSKKDSGC